MRSLSSLLSLLILIICLMAVTSLSIATTGGKQGIIHDLNQLLGITYRSSEEYDILSSSPIRKHPDSSFTLIPANPSFYFATDLSNKAIRGESSPIPDSFYLNRYLVTNEQYYEFLTATGRKVYPKHWSGGQYPEGKADHPVVWVSYQEALLYCAWLESRYKDWSFRLPTEAELEHAASGKDKTGYPWGNHPGTSFESGELKTHHNYNAVAAAYLLQYYGSELVTFNHPSSALYNTQDRLENVMSITPAGTVNGWADHKAYAGFIYTDLYKELTAHGGFTTPVTEYSTGISVYGVYDLSGNAYAWTSSQFVASSGADKGKTVQIVRGGSWYDSASSGKATYRGQGRKATGRYGTVGFRVAADPKSDQ